MNIVGELVVPFRDVLKAMIGNHWVSKSIFGMVFFIILASILGSTTKSDNENSCKYILNIFIVLLPIIGDIL